MLIWQALEEQANKCPEGVAIVAGEQSITYRHLAEQAARMAAGLTSAGLSAGDRLAVLLPNSLEAATTMLAANAAGLIVVPLLPSYPPAHMDYILGQTKPSALVSSPALSERIPGGAFSLIHAPIRAGSPTPGVLSYEDLSVMASATADCARPETTDPDPIGLLADTSGSTGAVKIVAHSQARLIERAGRFVETMALGAGDEGMAVFHLGRPVNFVCILLAMVRAGGTVSLVERPDPGLFWATYQERRPTYSFAPPGGTRSLFDHPAAEHADHSRLRFWICGGDVARAALRQKVARVTGRPLLEMYGSTEAGALAINPPGSPVKEGSVGKPMRGVEMRLADAHGCAVGDGEVGRLWVRSNDMMAGYWNDTLGTHRALGTGWYDTHDLLRRDADGDYWFEGRAVDIIVSDSGPMSTAPVVRAMLEFPGIEEAIVVGVVGAGGRHAGQVPVAFYRLGPSAGAPSVEALRAWVSDRAGAASVPAAFHGLDHWPLTPHGRVDRPALAALADARARSHPG